MLESMKVKNLTETKADLFIYGDIVSSEWDKWNYEDVAPENIRTFLDEIEGKDLNVFVNSYGGSVFAGLSIHSMLKRHVEKGHEVIVHVDGVAASISSVIAMAGTKLIVPKSSFLMIHKPWIATAGNSIDLRKAANDLDRIEEGLVNVYKDNLKEGVDISVIRTMITKETWLSGEDAANYFNIEIGESIEAVASVGEEFKSFTNIPEEVKQLIKQSQASHEPSHEQDELNEQQKDESIDDAVIEPVIDTMEDNQEQDIQDLYMQIEIL
ncbi:Clp protease ClpP [Peribacillus frigoritolerans]|uniref:head maturation protease, ClpP-related n=1 Tax=Peribacillus frigoritolerans TaxID=450367 RepID=UPI0020799CDB|nr:head maturation protease, ClpP-related [Peribacillus frigoritolerans]USK78963.1 Clp protease ClpP [Peribacillus frigoritolerans]